MQCVILAGDSRTWMGRRATDGPRALREVTGEPFIRHQLRVLADAGIDDVVICVGRDAEIIEDESARYCPTGMLVRCIRDGLMPLGAAGATRLAVENGLADEQFMVLYGDSRARVDYADVWASFDSSQYLGLMTVWRNSDPLATSNAGVRDGRIVVYRNGADGSNHPSMNYIDSGLGILTADAVLALVPVGTPHDLSTLYETVATRGRLQAYEVGHRSHEIGSDPEPGELDRPVTMEMRQ
jgi:NDP-sugar pyrophosphorylase family protein